MGVIIKAPIYPELCGADSPRRESWRVNAPKLKPPVAAVVLYFL